MSPPRLRLYVDEHVSRAVVRRIIFSQDDDFLRLHAAGVAHAGIVYAAQGTSVGDVIRGLLLICQILEPEEMRGHVEFL